jgi:CheY-like chemotaxis protein
VDARVVARIPVVVNITTNLRLPGAKLQGEGGAIALSHGGAEAPGAAVGWFGTIILLDVMMPGMKRHGT